MSGTDLMTVGRGFDYAPAETKDTCIIVVLEGRRKPAPAKVEEIAKSVEISGLISPITVRRDLGTEFILVTGLHRLEALIEQAPVDDLGFLDKATLLDCLQRAALGNAIDAPSLDPMNRTLSLLLWLTRQHQGTRQHCPPGPAQQKQTAVTSAAA